MSTRAPAPLVSFPCPVRVIITALAQDTSCLEHLLLLLLPFWWLVINTTHQGGGGGSSCSVV